jgi:hypothetical protein
MMLEAKQQLAATVLISLLIIIGNVAGLCEYGEEYCSVVKVRECVSYQ